MKSILKKYRLPLFMGLLLTTAITGCKRDDDDEPRLIVNEEELITSVVVTYSDTSSTNVKTAKFSDPDGEGGNNPIQFDTIRLQKGKTYQVNLAFLDESDPNDIEDITVEVREEGNEHLVCFDLDANSGVSIQKTDSDGTFPIGLTSKWTTDLTAMPFNGTITVILKHQPDVKDGTCAPGDTDVEINFPLIIN
jgi:hypothetical protein